MHRKMNPLGYAFEAWDDFGRYRRDEILGKGDARPVDASGELTDSGDRQLDGEFHNALELIHKLAESDKVRQVMIRHVFRYFMGRKRNAGRFKNTHCCRSGLPRKWRQLSTPCSFLSSHPIHFIYRKTLEPASR
ncbi:MAG UNVERIFIED_CONTAM: hypothetical protein LVR18_49285 [Planctomycetaceae bacterium]